MLSKEGELGLRLMQSLPHDAQKVAQIYTRMHDPAMPEWRWNRADQVRTFALMDHLTQIIAC